LTLFHGGSIGLDQLGKVERIYWQTARKVHQAAGDEPEQGDLRVLEHLLADTYHGNFSLFQSVPDAWAIGQLFPCMPIHRLQEEPTRRGILADLTCDSDGKIDQFVAKEGVNPTLALHELGSAPYLLGLFLVGAYQEILGDLHNLFGDTHAVHVSLDASGQAKIDAKIPGDTVARVLGHVQHPPEQVFAAAGAMAAARVADGAITAHEADQALAFIRGVMNTMTYPRGR